MDIKTQRDASRGRKSKAGGGKKSKATQEYTPLLISNECQATYQSIRRFVDLSVDWSVDQFVTKTNMIKRVKSKNYE